MAGGALGAWVVSYRLSYSAESLAHAMLPGLVVAALTGLPLLLGGTVGILFAALAVALAGRVPGLGRDTGVAVVVTTLFGLGALLALSPDTPAGLGALLFGDVLGASDTDLALAAALVVLVLLALRVLHGRLLVLGFDRVNARALGVAPLPVDAALLVLVALAIVVAVQGLGSLLVVAVLVAPAAAAAQLSDRMGARLAIGAGVAVLAGVRRALRLLLRRRRRGRVGRRRARRRLRAGLGGQLARSGAQPGHAPRRVMSCSSTWKGRRRATRRIVRSSSSSRNGTSRPHVSQTR